MLRRTRTRTRARIPEPSTPRPRPRPGFDDLLDDWRRRFPTVAVRAVTHALAPEVALLGHAVGAQLLLLGRRTGPQHPGGLSLGSTARTVLHHATCPVAVVPHGRRDDSGRRDR